MKMPGTNKPIRSTGHAGGVWPLLLALLLTVAVPSGVVLWFMNVAMQNERLAVRQRLRDVYSQKASEVQREIDLYWKKKLEQLQAGQAMSASQRFEQLVAAGAAGSVVILDEKGDVAYPTDMTAPQAGVITTPPQWDVARDLEYSESKHVEAADIYGKIAQSSKDIHWQARAWLASARCLIKAGKSKNAVSLICSKLLADEYKQATDVNGRLIAPNAMLLALQCIVDHQDKQFHDLLDKLAECLDDYSISMSSPQRVFLMRSLRQLDSASPEFKTLSAELMAEEYLSKPQSKPSKGRLASTSTPEIWRLTSNDGKTVALLRKQSLIDELYGKLELGKPFAGANFALSHDKSDAKPFLTFAASPHMPGWDIQVSLIGESPFDAAARQQRASYIWMGAIGVGSILALLLIVAGYLKRQARLTRLKNDLIATVSHELRTPLASMRVLVDTLSEGRCRSESQKNEYLHLIARENTRLTRLIENFLTFSRMERNKKAFAFASLDVSEIVASSVESAGERFHNGSCQLEVDIASDLPRINADQDALVTVLLNLLDNAYKYTREDKRITLRAYSDNGDVCLEVQDNGIGMRRREARKAFGRFYQVDQRLSREVGGCGLGLSIVRFIVDAHGGAVDVNSQAGKGSTFTVRLKAEQTQPEV